MPISPQPKKMTPVNDDLDRLSLPVHSGQSPFALNAPEVLFRADDWAWQFLRLKDDCKKEFLAQKGLEKRPTARWMPTESEPLTPSEEYCRKEFGLSTWLDPERTALPSIGDGNSWFFPIRAVLDWPNEPSLKPTLALRYGYAGIRNALRHGEFLQVSVNMHIPVQRRLRSHPIGFLVNCSVPPDAQLRTIALLCQEHRFLDDENLRAGGISEIKSKGRKRTWAVKQDSTNEITDFPQACLWRTTSESHHVNCQPAEIWRVVTIDIHRPIQRQLDKASETLRKLARGANTNASRPSGWPGSYKLEIQAKGEIDPKPTDGHYLKALVIIKELNSFGFSAAEIDVLLPKKPTPIGKAKTEVDAEHAYEFWLDGRVKRIERLLLQADDVVKEG